MDCVLKLTEAYQIYDLHTTFPGNNGLKDWLSNSMIYALKLTWLLYILTVLLFLYIDVFEYEVIHCSKRQETPCKSSKELSTE